MKDKTSQEALEALVFYKNAKKGGFDPAQAESGEAQLLGGGTECNANCDCYVELELTRAAGVGGYRMGM
jgi:hypothetical protein